MKNTKLPRLPFRHLLRSLVLTSFCLSSVLAQDDGGDSGKLAVGVKTGVNFNQMDSHALTLGFTGGGYANYAVLDFLDVQLELLYNQQGGTRQDYFQNFSPLDGDLIGISYYHRSVELHNLEIPVIARATLPELAGGSVTPKVLFGLAYGFTLGAFEVSDQYWHFRQNSPSTLVVPVSNQRENVGANYEQHQFGLIAGMGVDFNVGDRTLSTEIRYRRGLNEVNIINFVIPEQGGQLYTSTLSINFALSLFKFL